MTEQLKRFCDDCNEKREDCVCEEPRDFTVGKDFKWEYAHERLTTKITQFKEISSKYE